MPRQIGAVEQGVHRRFAEAPAAMIGAFFVADRHPCIVFGLQRLDAVVEHLAEGDAVELVE